MRQLLFLLAAPVLAHELDTTVTFTPPAIVVRAAYGGTEPVPYAKVQVFSQASATEFVAGVTDPHGYFSFVPNGPGTWKLVIDDEEGHRREVPIEVPNPFTAAPVNSAAGMSRIERAAFGIAFIVGATGFLYGFKARARNARR